MHEYHQKVVLRLKYDPVPIRPPQKIKQLTDLPLDTWTELLSPSHPNALLPATARPEAQVSARGSPKSPAQKRRLHIYVPGWSAPSKNALSRDQASGSASTSPYSQSSVGRTLQWNFITGLPESEGFNAICTLICRLPKEHHYVPCRWGEGGNVH